MAHSIPIPMRVMPKAMAALGEVFVTIRWERPAKVMDVTDAVIQAAPAARAEKPSTCCM